MKRAEALARQRRIINSDPAGVDLHDLVAVAPAAVGDVHAHPDGAIGADFAARQPHGTIVKFRVTPAVSEWKQRLTREKAIRAAGHGVIFEGWQILR